MSSSKNKFCIVLISSFILSSCVPAAIGGVVGIGKSVYQDKTVGEEISDQTVWAKIRTSLMKNNIDNLVGDVNVKVHEGRVLLTGTVKHREDIIKIIRICWEQDGVKEVINELKVEDESSGGLKQYAQDTWITARLKSRMLFNKDIKSINYNVITINGTVYLIGLARSQEELGAVTDLSSHIGGVKEVISYVRVKKNPDVANDESDISANSVEEFTAEDITDNNKADPVESKPVNKPEEENKNIPLKVEKKEKEVEAKKKESVKKKQNSDEIFAEEDFDSF